MRRYVARGCLAYGYVARIQNQTKPVAYARSKQRCSESQDAGHCQLSGGFVVDVCGFLTPFY